VELRAFFDRAIRASFHDLAIGNDPASPYLADLLTRFARTENLYPRGTSIPRLETVVEMLIEAGTAWDGSSFQPEHEVTVSQHIGDFTLFMTGIFRERVERTASVGYYVDQGKRAYHFVSEHGRATSRADAAAAAPLFRRLADRFEGYAGALDYARRVYFIDHPAHPFFQLRFG
jgi:hypothetical protein